MTEKTNIDDIIGIVKTEEKTDSVELKKEYYKSRMTENKRYYLGNGKLLTVCDSNKGGSDGFNGLTQYEVVDLLNEQDKEIKRLKCINRQLEERLDKSIALDMSQCGDVGMDEKERYDWDLNGIWDYNDESDEYIESYEDITKLLNEQEAEIKRLKKENQGLQFKIIDMLDFVKEKGTVTREEIKKWWNGDVE